MSVDMTFGMGCSPELQMPEILREEGSKDAKQQVRITPTLHLEKGLELLQYQRGYFCDSSRQYLYHK
jgi:hypothetical protein